MTPGHLQISPQFFPCPLSLASGPSLELALLTGVQSLGRDGAPISLGQEDKGLLVPVRLRSACQAKSKQMKKRGLIGSLSGVSVSVWNIAVGWKKAHT